MGAVRPDALLDLEAELPGRGEDQGPDGRDADVAPLADGTLVARIGRTARVTPRFRGAGGLPARRPLGVEELEERQDERGRLPGARLGAGEDVTAGEDRGDRLALDGGGLGVA